MKIRTATLADVEALRKLEATVPTAAHWSEQKYREMFFDLGPRRIAIVAEGAEQIQGFLVARVAADEWEIENVVVALQARRRGLGSALLRECLKRAGDGAARAVFLEVRESNEEAKRLYEKMGFQRSGLRPRYYGNPQEDALVYRKESV